MTRKKAFNFVKSHNGYAALVRDENNDNNFNVIYGIECICYYIKNHKNTIVSIYNNGIKYSITDFLCNEYFAFVEMNRK